MKLLRKIFKKKINLTSVQRQRIRIIYKRRNCGYCRFLISHVNLWCRNGSAVSARGTSIPGCNHCPYWKPDKGYIKHELRNL